MTALRFTLEPPGIDVLAEAVAPRVVATLGLGLDMPIGVTSLYQNDQTCDAYVADLSGDTLDRFEIMFGELRRAGRFRQRALASCSTSRPACSRRMSRMPRKSAPTRSASRGRSSREASRAGRSGLTSAGTRLASWTRSSARRLGAASRLKQRASSGGARALSRGRLPTFRALVGHDRTVVAYERSGKRRP